MMYKHMPLKENNMNQLINLMFIKLYRDSTPSIPKVKNFGDVVQIDQKNSNIKWAKVVHDVKTKKSCSLMYILIKHHEP